MKRPLRTAEAGGAQPTRIADMIERLGAIGGEEGGGVSRLAFTPDERAAHARVAGWLRDAGLRTRTDVVGNTIATRDGTSPELPAIAVGSHLDSVYHGGRFDGAAGVVAAVELVTLLQERRVALAHPLRVVAFAGEEGARFGEPCIGSKAMVGRWSPEDLPQLLDRDGVSLADAMRSLGLDPDEVAGARWSPDECAAYLELHIEQADVLERSGLPIGLVDAVSGSTRLGLRFRGRAQHSGGTPMATRADALVAAAEVVVEGERIAMDHRHRGTRVTFGRISAFPNSITTIPGSVELSVDVRDIDNDRQRETAALVLGRALEIGERRGVEVDSRLMADTSPTVLPMWLRSQLAATCDDLGTPYRVMTSGASHDAQIVNAVAPGALVFVPSRAGLSHVPEEWTSARQIAQGVDVLFAAVQRIDGFLTEFRHRTDARKGLVP